MEYRVKGASKETHVQVWVLWKSRADEGERQVGVGMVGGLGVHVILWHSVGASTVENRPHC